MKRSILSLLLLFGLHCAGSEQPKPALSVPEPAAAPAELEAEPPAVAVAEPPAEESSHSHRPPWDRLLRYYRPDPYALDHLSRAAERDERGRLQCPDLHLEMYRGDVVPYHRSIKIYPDFRERLKKFETIVADVATEVYGRPPKSIVHLGTYNCRVIRHRKYRLSEHALGNAIDIAEFRFSALPRDERADAGKLGKDFRVSVLKHWDGTDGVAATHSLFLKSLVQALNDDLVFRGMIVPPAPGHLNHLHLDMGRWRYLRGDVTLPPDLGG